MDSLPSYDDHIPWDLVSSSFLGDLGEEESRALDEWLSLNPANRSHYEALRKAWEQGLPDYELYRRADAEAGWNALKENMAARPFPENKGKVISMIVKRNLTRWAAAAILIGAFLFIGNRWLDRGQGGTGGIVYEAGISGQRKIALPDGSFLTLKPGARLRLDKGFNQSDRILSLERGEVYFDVRSLPSKPFVVNMGSSSVRDIGTLFTIYMLKDSIEVSVLSGRVRFTKNSTAETRELSEGMALSFNTAGARFGEYTYTGMIGDSSRNLLKFDNSPLAEVIGVLQSMSGKTIILGDTTLVEKRLTARLDGETFENAMKIICTSLDLGYAEIKGIYILKTKTGR